MCKVFWGFFLSWRHSRAGSTSESCPGSRCRGRAGTRSACAGGHHPANVRPSREPSYTALTHAGAGPYLVLVAQLDGAAAVLGQEDGVADADADRDQVAVLVTGARADGDDLALVQLVLGLLRDVEARRGFLAVATARRVAWRQGSVGLGAVPPSNAAKHGERYLGGAGPLDQHAVQERHNALVDVVRRLQPARTKECGAYERPECVAHSQARFNAIPWWTSGRRDGRALERGHAHPAATYKCQPHLANGQQLR